MSETKKGLRIAAGILLLIPACLSVFSAVTTFVSMRENLDVIAFSLCWSAVNAVLEILIAVFVLARKFTVSAVLECLLLLAAPFVMNLVYAALQGGGFSLDLIRQYWAAWLSLNGAIQFVGMAASILIIVGLFLHSRKTKPLLIIGAVLFLLASLAQLGATLMNYVGNTWDAYAYRAMATAAVATAVPALFMFTALILLAVWFGAQRKAAE